MAKQWDNNAWVTSRLRRDGAGAAVVGAAEDALDLGIPASDVYAAASRGGLLALDRLVDSYNVIDAGPAPLRVQRYQAPQVMRQVVERAAAPDYTPFFNGLRAMMMQARGRPADQAPMMPQAVSYTHLTLPTSDLV